METKVCSKCGVEKNVSEFNKKKNGKDGLNYWCKECCKQHNKQYYKNNVLKRTEYNKQYRKNNALQIAEKKTVQHR